MPSAILPAIPATRSFISRAALLVKVTARMFSAGMRLSFNRWTMRVVMTWVLPEPAPARISSAPSVWLTACCCGRLSFFIGAQV